MIYGIPLFLLLLLICRILSICYHHWPDAITYDFEYIHACHFSVFLTIKNILTPPVTGTCRQMINAYKNYIYIALFSASLFLQCHLEFSKKKKKERKEKLLIVIVIINILLLVSFYLHISGYPHRTIYWSIKSEICCCYLSFVCYCSAFFALAHLILKAELIFVFTWEFGGLILLYWLCLDFI